MHVYIYIYIYKICFIGLFTDVRVMNKNIYLNLFYYILLLLFSSYIIFINARVGNICNWIFTDTRVGNITSKPSEYKPTNF
jgi:hypothetical protein